MPVKKGAMVSIVSKSWQSMSFKPEQQWGYALMLTYARQIDRANWMMQEALKAEIEIAEEGFTLGKVMGAKLDRLKDMLDAQTTIANIGPKLLDLMVKFGMTPVVEKQTRGGTSGAQSAATDPIEDELARRRQERGAASRTS